MHQLSDVMVGIRWYLFLFLVVTMVYKSNGNAPMRGADSIRIGQPVPEIILANITNFSQNEFSTRELNGKPLILYFFSAGCRASFTHFAEINQLYNVYQNDLTLIMVGIDLNDNIENIFYEYSKKYNLTLPTVFDKSLYKEYNIRGVPHVIWIRENGIVQAITNVLDQGYLDKFLEGKEFDFINWGAKRRKLIEYNPDEPFLVNGNGGESQDFIQRSLLAEWKIGMPNDVPFGEPNKSPLQELKFLQAIGRGLDDLYRLAYFGKIYWTPEDSLYGEIHYSPILEIGHTSKFNADYNLGKNLFCYSQVLPPERRNPGQMMQVMQRDLKNFFGYDVAIETRQMPYLGLVVIDEKKVKLSNKNGGPDKSSSSLIHVNYINKPISSLIRLLDLQLNLGRNDFPLLDETGVRGNIDISFSAIMTDFNEVKHELQKLGLDIVKRERPMRVIVIRESQL